MTRFDSPNTYLSLAEQLYCDGISEFELIKAGILLPTLDQQLLEELAQEADAAGLTQPRLGWAIAMVVDTTANVQEAPLFLRSLSAWHLGRAANAWVQPARAAAALKRARGGFDKLGKDGWLAACDWQRNALPWTRSNFKQATKELEQSLSALEQTGMSKYVPHCRLSLAYAQMLTDQMEIATENVTRSEADFAAKNDMLNQTRCWLTQASILRRQAQYEEALEKLENASRVLSLEEASIDQAKADFQIAYCYFLRSDNYRKAIEHFEKAREVFIECDLELWEAQCANGLAQVHTHSGNINGARKLLQHARDIYSRYDIVGIKADNANDLGRLERMRGRFELSIQYFKQAEILYRQLGSELYLAVAITNQGKAYSQLSRFQDALQCLERAAKHLQKMDNPSRLAACEMHLADVWLQLGKFEKVYDHLDKATALYRKAQQPVWVATVYLHWSRILLGENKFEEAIEFLQNASVIFEECQSLPQISRAQLLIGQTLTASDQPRQGLEYLLDAKKRFVEMDMLFDQAACLLSLGDTYVKLGRPELAQRNFTEALDVSDKTVPEVDWRAYAGMAAVTKTAGDSRSALGYYKQAVSGLTNVRRNFWQPSLAGGYLQTSKPVLGSAINLAYALDDKPAVLDFVEGSKAQTFLRQFGRINYRTSSEFPKQFSDLRADIDWLHNQLRTKTEGVNRIQALLSTREIHVRLAEKFDKYNQLFEANERSLYRDNEEDHVNQIFELQHFRQQADLALNAKWLAVNYYLSKDTLTSVWITPDDLQIFQTKISNRIRIALEALGKMQRRGEVPTKEDLSALGRLMFPPQVQEYLNPETYLLIVPHNRLHGVPWPALSLGEDQRLVEICIPASVPSLESLRRLWDRSEPNKMVNFKNGLLVALSSFEGKYQDLPEIENEIKVIEPRLGSLGQALTGKRATWSELKGLHQGEGEKDQGGLTRFGFLHIASHIFPNLHTGRLCGIALKDGNIWLDQLRDLAPLPSLVTLSGCNGIQSQVYVGDEHLDLPTTCLLAGSQSVIGSLWPVLDSAAVAIMGDFYTFLDSNLSPGQALTYAQRRALNKGIVWHKWGGFSCVGLP